MLDASGTLRSGAADAPVGVDASRAGDGVAARAAAPAKGFGMELDGGHVVKAAGGGTSPSAPAPWRAVPLPVTPPSPSQSSWSRPRAGATDRIFMVRGRQPAHGSDRLADTCTPGGRPGALGRGAVSGPGLCKIARTCSHDDACLVRVRSLFFHWQGSVLPPCSAWALCEHFVILSHIPFFLSSRPTAPPFWTSA